MSTISSLGLYLAWCSGNPKYLDVELPSAF